MSLSKQITFDGSWTEFGHVQVRKITRVMENGKELSKAYHRHVISPGDDYSGEVDEDVKKVAQAIHTPKRIAAYKAMIAKNEKAMR